VPTAQADLFSKIAGGRGTLLAFTSGVLEHTLSEEERNQIGQTIEMFEAITQTQPDDYQSLRILKEAYQKLNQAEDTLRISRRLAEAYFNVGAYALAIQEGEAVLREDPNAPEILALMGEIESRMQQAGRTMDEARAENSLVLTPDSSSAINGATDPGSLAEIGGRNTGQLRKRISAADAEVGNEQLAKFLIVQQMFPEEQVNAALAAVKAANKDMPAHLIARSLLSELCDGDEKKSDRILSALIDRTKFAYVPLEYYDIDRQVVRMLPDDLAISRLFVPFDLISRTIMIAVCNPFDAAAREAVQQSLDYTVTWYLAKPSAIMKTLQEVYRLEPRG
jgi:tetratricopeptide (TPR) repeat protein